MSRRFGSDKAMARIDGVTLLDHVHAALQPQVDDIVLCGRSWLEWTSIPDVPGPGLGPLGAWPRPWNMAAVTASTLF